MTKAEEYTIGKGFADGMTWENEAGESLRDVLPEGNRMLGSWASARLPRRSWRLDEDSIPYIMISDDNGPMYVLTRDHDESGEATRAWWFFEEDRSCVLMFDGCWDTGHMLTPVEIKKILVDYCASIAKEGI